MEIIDEHKINTVASEGSFGGIVYCKLFTNFLNKHGEGLYARVVYLTPACATEKLTGYKIIGASTCMHSATKCFSNQ